MTETKYGNYIINLDFNKDGRGLYRQVTRFDGAPFGLDFHVEYGTHVAAGNIGADPPQPHTHDYDQVLVFMGADPVNIGDLGAEVELCLGPQCERHVFASSTAVSIPRGLAHFPAAINTQDHRFIYMEVSCGASADRETPIKVDRSVLNSAPVLTWESEYRDHFISMAFHRKGPWHYGPRNRDDSGGHLTFINSKLPEFDFTIMHETLKNAPYRFMPVPDKPHVHQKLEILTFMGADPDDLSNLGGEVEVYMGKEMERHVLTRPAAVVIPGKLAHCPVIVTRVDKPFFLTDIRPFGGEPLPPVRKKS
jgi:hypothetical protein